MTPTQICLIENPHIKVKMTHKFDEIPEIGDQSWAIAALLSYAVSVPALRSFLARTLCVVSGRAVSSDSQMVTEAINVIERIAAEM